MCHSAICIVETVTSAFSFTPKQASHKISLHVSSEVDPFESLHGIMRT